MAVEATYLLSLRFSNPGRVTREKPSSIVLRSGVNLPDTPERRQLAIMVKIPSNRLAADTDITKIPGIETAGTGYPLEVQCTEYVFGHEMDEPWSRQEAFWYPDKFLAKRDYEVVDIPEPGDIVAYGGFHGRNLHIPFINHYGIYLGGGRVRSKFGSYDVYDHPWYLIPPYGNTIFFFRKAVENQPAVQAVESMAQSL
jgi:hypothetical protein